MIRLVLASCTKVGAFAEVVELATGTFEDVQIERRCLGNAHPDGERVNEMLEDKEWGDWKSG